MFAAVASRLASQLLGLQQNYMAFRQTTGEASDIQEVARSITFPNENQGDLTDGNEVLEIKFPPSISGANLSLQHEISQVPIKFPDFTIEAGKFVLIKGPSGCGKSTLLKLIAGLMSPSSGHIRIQESQTEYNPTSSLKGRLYLPQEFLVINGSVAENVEFPLDDRKTEGYELPDFVAEGFNLRFLLRTLAEQRPIQTRLLTEPIEDFSGGEIQRIALVRGIVNQAPLVMLDEPTSALDEQMRASVAATLVKAFEGSTLIVVSHTTEFDDFADDILFLQPDHYFMSERGDTTT